MDRKIRVLFVCVHNSARSQMAEAFLKDFGGELFEVYSAGLEPGDLNTLIVEIMSEIGYDISANKTKSISDFIRFPDKFDYIISVCDEASQERCPVFPKGAKKIHWAFSDPSSLSGEKERKIILARKIRDEIKKRVCGWIKELHVQRENTSS